ncbi:uncharacterized protein I303_106774 [Kwoniella dejecticola CBS 10117]|uniref:Uncharacterized protein n=1 Tax=Kwoniella dejecticola CBS 10117 TaxID=1296121 RepID=A0A1A5ZTQ3_9TREE|nr:uncharacterized protein I303_08584 [Kwoniella dejecticola CBS 10117]OBR81199.1 hypothetical protein I303_08584 [Kwoniella dejecticola CBS 10117]
MPVFRPPLAYTSLVYAVSHNPFIQLNFLATFADKEDHSGSWEIWTDLPRLDDFGAPISQPGDWTAVQLHPYTQPGPSNPGHHQPIDQISSNVTIQIKAKSDGLIVAPDDVTYLASLIIPATVGREYSYTYRHITAAGETHWLGGMGGNGIVKVDMGARDSFEGEIKTGRWSDGAEMDGTWTGSALAFETINDITTPVITTVPSRADLSASLLLLTSRASSQLSTPFHFPISSETKKSPTLSGPNLVVFAGSFLTIKATSSLPERTDAAVYATATGRVRQTLTAALRIARWDTGPFRLAEIDGNNDDIAALAVHRGDDRSESAYLVILAGTIQSPQVITITIDNQTFGASPLALCPSNSDEDPSFTYLDGGLEGSHRHLTLRLDPGAVGEVYHLAEFIELRGVGHDDSIWICAPNALQAEIGEEEFGEVDHLVDADPGSKSIGLTLAEGDHHEELPAKSVEPLRATEQDPSTGSNAQDSCIPHRDSDAASSQWWLLRAVGRFFVNIWEFLVSSFRSKAAVPEGNDENEENQANVDSNERTPLLGSYSMSRETSSSSTAVDSLATPASTKEAPHRVDFIDGAVTPIADQPIIDIPARLPKINVVQIRSYAVFAFNASRPFKFLLPPHSAEVIGRLKFTMKEKADQRWNEIQPSLSTPRQEGKCNVLLFEADPGHGGAEWEVRVERI